MSGIQVDYFTYKDHVVRSDCESWSSFITNGLKLPFEDIRVSSISINQMNENLRTSATASFYASCKDEAKVEFMVEKLKKGSQFLQSCNGFNWRMFYCNGKQVLCANCEKSCTICPGRDFVVKPCGLDNCKTYAAHFSIVSFGVKKAILYPQFNLPFTISTVGIDSIVVSLNVSTIGKNEKY